MRGKYSNKSDIRTWGILSRIQTLRYRSQNQENSTRRWTKCTSSKYRERKYQRGNIQKRTTLKKSKWIQHYSSWKDYIHWSYTCLPRYRCLQSSGYCQVSRYDCRDDASETRSDSHQSCTWLTKEFFKRHELKSFKSLYLWPFLRSWNHSYRSCKYGNHEAPWKWSLTSDGSLNSRESWYLCCWREDVARTNYCRMMKTKQRFLIYALWYIRTRRNEDISSFWRKEIRKYCYRVWMISRSYHAKRYHHSWVSQIRTHESHANVWCILPRTQESWIQVKYRDDFPVLGHSWKLFLLHWNLWSSRRCRI